ncbi:hypothetical protein EBB54_21775 [Schaedlerella arabinosiphila]|uniref:Uncharacterized protein n=1 Tax=Schaedlerella arabinosiphila TaxID=2044587 RepID=A0A3R8JRV1_9FIRM|nr:hypothetical protein EBB54_21775 [Schaedlerella arabinosiphila]
MVIFYPRYGYAAPPDEIFCFMKGVGGRYIQILFRVRKELKMSDFLYIVYECRGFYTIEEMPENRSTEAADW